MFMSIFGRRGPTDGEQIVQGLEALLRGEKVRPPTVDEPHDELFALEETEEIHPEVATDVGSPIPRQLKRFGGALLTVGLLVVMSPLVVSSLEADATQPADLGSLSPEDRAAALGSGLRDERVLRLTYTCEKELVAQGTLLELEENTGMHSGKPPAAEYFEAGDRARQANIPCAPDRRLPNDAGGKAPAVVTIAGVNLAVTISGDDLVSSGFNYPTVCGSFGDLSARADALPPDTPHGKAVADLAGLEPRYC
jgi:hypothetical protein